MSPRSRLRPLALPLALVAAISGCGAAAVASTTPSATHTAAPAALPASSATDTAAPAPSRLATLTAIARQQYSSEIHGGVAFGTLHRVGRDPRLLRLLASGDAAATRAYVQRQYKAVWYHWHVSRMRIQQGSRVVVETGVPFVVAPVQMTLHGAGGRVLGTLQVSIQDEIGFVRLMHRNHPVDVVVRGTGSGQVRSSLPAAAHAKLPASGSATIAGRRYWVSSFRERAWNHEPVTVWILEKA